MAEDYVFDHWDLLSQVLPRDQPLWTKCTSRKCQSAKRDWRSLRVHQAVGWLGVALVTTAIAQIFVVALIRRWLTINPVTQDEKSRLTAAGSGKQVGAHYGALEEGHDTSGSEVLSSLPTQQQNGGDGTADSRLGKGTHADGQGVADSDYALLRSSVITKSRSRARGSWIPSETPSRVRGLSFSGSTYCCSPSNARRSISQAGHGITERLRCFSYFCLLGRGHSDLSVVLCPACGGNVRLVCLNVLTLLYENDSS